MAVNTRELVQDYILYRLERDSLLDQFQLHQGNHHPATTPGRTTQAMRILGTEFDSRYREVFAEMGNQLHITRDTARPTFDAIVNELFSDGVRWGRIVALFSFGGSLAVQCVQKELPSLVNQVIDWVSNYIDTYLQSWIYENNGWVSFIFITRIIMQA